MELIATPPVLVMVTGTIGMGQYGGGVEGNSAVDGVMCKLTVFATAVVVGATVVGGLVVGGLVVGGLVVAGGTVVGGMPVVVATGPTVGVVTDACAMGLARWCAAVDEATIRGVP